MAWADLVCHSFFGAVLSFVWQRRARDFNRIPWVGRRVSPSSADDEEQQGERFFHWKQKPKRRTHMEIKKKSIAQILFICSFCILFSFDFFCFSHIYIFFFFSIFFMFLFLFCFCFNSCVFIFSFVIYEHSFVCCCCCGLL